jgi:hypothetical protein
LSRPTGAISENFDRRQALAGLFTAGLRALVRAGRAGPRADADLESFVGFGRWLAWTWRTGKGLPIPVSRAVVRFAFGGKIREDDIADANPEVAGDARIAEWVRQREAALTAIQAGVFAGEIVADDDPLLPRVFALRPFTAARGAKKTAGPFETPLVRQAIWDEHARAKDARVTSSTRFG